MKNYQNLLADVLENGERLQNRTGTATYSVISRELRWDLSKGFPAVTTKKLAWNAVIGELLWFLSGSNNINELRKLTELSDTDFCIWQQNLDEYNERIGENRSNPLMGYIYGSAWRQFYSADRAACLPIDQIDELIDNIRLTANNPSHPSARRLIVTAWHPDIHSDNELDKCALPPCHYGFQCFVRNGKLSLKWIQRSVN